LGPAFEFLLFNFLQRFLVDDRVDLLGLEGGLQFLLQLLLVLLSQVLLGGGRLAFVEVEGFRHGGQVESLLVGLVGVVDGLELVDQRLDQVARDLVGLDLRPLLVHEGLLL